MGASLRKKDGIYCGRFYDPARKPQRRELSLRTGYKDAAVKRLREYEARWADPKDSFDPWKGEEAAREGLLTVAEARDAFLASKAHLQYNTRRNYAS